MAISADEREDSNELSSCLGGFTIPSEEEGKKRANAVFSSFSDGGSDDDAVWVYQGYPWSRVSANSGCNKTKLQEWVRGFVSGVPKDPKTGKPRLLVLDLIADYNNANWQLWNNENGTLLAGAESIWCALENWGGAVHVGGDLDYALTQVPVLLSQTLLDNKSKQQKPQKQQKQR